VEGKPEYLLELNGIVKRYPGVTALDHVCLKVRPQSVHVLMGENGAGKSTLMKILAGEEQANEGEIVLRGKKVQFHNPKQALDNGVAMIHQELTPILDMTVAENLYIGREPKQHGLFYDKRTMLTDAEELLKKLKLNISPKTKMRDLTVAQMQMVEICKTLSYNATVIIMDEPTSALSGSEVDTLFTVLKQLVDEGKSIIYISHRMEEIYRIADEISIFRDGKYVGTYLPEELSRDELVFKMVDRELQDAYVFRQPKLGEEALRVEGASRGNLFHNISFCVHKGEILGFAGLMGSGRTEIVEAIFGLGKLDKGDIYVNGEKIQIKSCRDAIKIGIGLITDDRKYKGLIMPLSIEDNILLPNLRTYSRGGVLLNMKSMANTGEQYIRMLRIKTPSPKQLVSNLSGGNQQKVVLAKWLARHSNIMIFDEPTKGIDVGAKAEFYTLISGLADEGVAVIFISSEMEEVIGMSDRVIVFHEGNISGELSKAEISQQAIMKLAIGSN
jgi:inositol transport system ATP-binding protein